MPMIDLPVRVDISTSRIGTIVQARCTLSLRRYTEYSHSISTHPSFESSPASTLSLF